MSTYRGFTFCKKSFYILTICLLSCSALFAQQTNISDFIIFGGKVAPGQTAPAAPGYGVQLGSSSTIQGGSVGSYHLVKSTGNLTINGNIYSGGNVQLANSNTVTGRITAANSLTPPLPQPILSVGSSANIGGNIDVNGNIVIGGGTVSGRVTHPAGTSYSGPVPAGGNITGPPSLPGLPQMPAITNFPAVGTTNINSTQTITPNAYGNVTLNGNKTLTFSGTGVYTFNSISNSGTSNNFVFDFKNDATGTIKIYVYGNIDLNKVKASIINGGSASRIYCETHGAGTTSNPFAFKIANGSSGQASKWLGSVWAPYAAINMGSGTGSTDVTGALWSGTQVNIQSGVTINFAPFVFCSNPPNANAGPDKALDFVNQTTLNGSSTTPGVTFSWGAINGGVITSPANAATITVSAAGTYILSVILTSNSNCVSTDTAIVTGKVNNIIGSELSSVLQNFNPNAPPSPFFLIQSDSIFIDVIAKEGKRATVLALLTNPGFGLTNLLDNGASNFIITGLFPISKLDTLNTLDSIIVYCRPYYGAFNNSGIVSSAGDSSVRAHLVRTGYNLQGEGIKIGVLSDSYNTILAATTTPIISNTAAQDVVNGDLPGPGNPNGNLIPVTVLKESPFVRSDEGRGMLQIIHDIVPKAQLYFRTGVETANDFAAGILELQQAGCNIIVDDITYTTEPFLKDGVVASAVETVTAAGITYISAAGNFGNKSYENTFIPVPAPGNLTGKAHNFGTNDAFLSVNLSPGNYTIVLQWLDDIYSLGETATGGTKNDLDIYLTPNTDGSALFGFNRNNLFRDPIEFLPFTLTAATQTNILIVNTTANSNPARFKIVIFRGDITFNEYVTGGSTIIGQSNALGAITVGAVRYDKAPPYPGPLDIESFSSRGGTFVNGIVRNKPDIVAPDGVNTTVNLGIDYDNNSYSNFFGTSAAAPHTAGVAALIMDGRKKFLNQNLTTPAEIRAILQNSATNIGTPGFDLTSGFGFINADSAMRTFAKPDPSLIQLVVPANVTPGSSPFTLTVTGLNLSPTSVVRFRDSTLSTTFVNTEQATAQVPAFIGDPPISVYTPPVSISGLDGGTSDTLKFFGVVKKNIIVTADNKVKKYAQQMSQFTATILVDGIPLANSGLTLQQTGLDIMTLTSPASVNSNVGTYTIIPARAFDPENSVDVGLLELYNYTFNTGTMTIEKLPVTVTAQDVTATYGEKLPDIQFTYEFDPTNIPDPVALLNSIQSSHQNQLAKDVQGNDVLGLVNKQAVTIVNGQAIPIVNGQAVTIVNGQAVTIVNGQAIPIVNGQALTIVNGLVTAINPVTLNQSEINNLSFQVAPQSLQTTRTITNQTLVNGTYVTSSTEVVDLTQESILDYNVNSAQTYMLSALSNVNGRGMIDAESYTNGQAITIVNGQAVTIVNGQAITIVNGQAVTIVNGQAVTIVNGQAIPIVNGQGRTAVVLNESEIGQGVNQLRSLNMITGLDAGAQFIIPGSLVNSNFDITHIAGEITIQPAPVVITPTAGQSKVFGTADPVFTYTNNAGLTANQLTGNLSRSVGENAGSYAYTLGTLSAGANYALSLSAVSPVATFAITPKLVTITPNSGQTKTYGDPDPVFTFTNNAGLAAGNFTGALGRTAGNNVGNYSFTLGNLSAGNNYSLSLAGTNTFAITKAPLQVKADLKVIFKNDPPPAYTSTLTGLKNGDNPTVSHITNPVYTQGSPAGVYTIIPSLPSFANAGNYTITFINGTLYVNPKGPGAKKLIPKLDCVVEIANPLPGQFRYIARFTCDNNNATPVYVPVGPDNVLSSDGGTFNGSAQPVLFNPGITAFEAPFDGIKLTWTVKTYETNHKTAVATNASSSSGRCSNNTRSSITTSAVAEVIPGIEKKKAKGYLKLSPAGIKTSEVTLYPNPAADKVIINIQNDLLNEKGLLLYDISGRSYPVKVTRRISQSSLELDVTGLAKGLYLIRIKQAGDYMAIRFVKE